MGVIMGTMTDVHYKLTSEHEGGEVWPLWKAIRANMSYSTQAPGMRPGCNLSAYATGSGSRMLTSIAVSTTPIIGLILAILATTTTTMAIATTVANTGAEATEATQPMQIPPALAPPALPAPMRHPHQLQAPRTPPGYLPSSSPQIAHH